MNPPHISVCICTYRRPDLLERSLNAVRELETAGVLTYSVVVADNDENESGRPVVDAFARSCAIPITYCVEPVQNIALARNCALRVATGEYVAFMDDDEFPVPAWLRRMLEVCNLYGAAGVQGPVRPHFDTQPPRWLERGGFCERPEHPTGFKVPWEGGRTGNVLFRRSILNDVREPFRAEFGTMAEDQDFFRRLNEKGHTFVWCNEGVIYEVVPPARWTRSFLLKRALLRGQMSLRHPVGRLGKIAKSIVAVPCYAFGLPIFFVAGQHVFMKYLMSLCDHLGRLLALVRLNPVRERGH
jgi:glycosyltransferase involved in cell wall biosynthesis